MDRRDQRTEARLRGEFETSLAARAVAERAERKLAEVQTRRAGGLEILRRAVVGFRGSVGVVARCLARWRCRGAREAGHAAGERSATLEAMLTRSEAEWKEALVDQVGGRPTSHLSPRKHPYLELAVLTFCLALRRPALPRSASPAMASR